MSLAILAPFNSFFSLFKKNKNNTILPLMQEHDVEVGDRLEAAFGSKDSEATLTVPFTKSSGDDSIDIMPSPKKKAGHSQVSYSLCFGLLSWENYFQCI